MRTLLCLAAVLFLLTDGPPVAARQAQKSALVTVVSESGTSSRDLKAADFVVKEDGKKREVLDAKLATDPLSVALLIDVTQPAIGGSRPIQDLRNAATVFVRTIHRVSPDSQIALVPFAGAATVTLDFTSKLEDLESAISRLYPGQQPIGVMLEAMGDAAKRLAEKPAPRRAMVTIDFNSPEGSADRQVQQSADAITNSGATLWTASIRGTGPTAQNREEVLNKMTKATGGKRYTSVDSSGLEGMITNIAASLTSQYIVTFAHQGDAAAKTTTFETADGKKKVNLTPFMR